MKVTGSGKIDTSPVRRKNAPRAGDGAGFSVDMPSQTVESKPLTGAVPVSVVGSLLSIQEIHDQAQHHPAPTRQAEEMLDLLDDVRHGLLTGAMPVQKLRRLLTLSSIKRDSFVDPRLNLILADIELRAKVELAKLEMSRIIP